MGCCTSGGFPGRRARSRARGGFTLVELLVVITIIGILIALLLPAVQSAREAARRLQCKNNLYQMGRAALQHEEKQGHIPTGGWGWFWVGDPDRGFTKDQPGGWVYNILPFMDQENLHQLGAGGSDSEKRAAANALTKTPLTTMNCPSRRKSILYPKPWDGTYVARNAERNDSNHNVAARGDYAMNCGSQNCNEYFAGPGSLAAGDAPGFGWHNPKNCNGVSYERSEVQMAHVRDGASNTILIGEKYMNADHYATGEVAADNENIFVGFDNDIYRTTHPSYRPLQDRPGYTSTKRFGSVHSVGCHFVFCDGSVRVIDFFVDPTVYSRLGNRHDGQAIDYSEL